MVSVHKMVLNMGKVSVQEKVLIVSKMMSVQEKVLKMVSVQEMVSNGV